MASVPADLGLGEPELHFKEAELRYQRMPLFQSINDFDMGVDVIRRHRYGVIETAEGRLVAIRCRPWPKLLSRREIWPVGDRYHANGVADRCRLYYNQPLRWSNFLSLKYIISTGGTRYVTIRAALTVLDAVARVKQSDAILCDAANSRISERLLARFGWEAHRPQRWHRNYIKRFYGKYPEIVLPKVVSV